MENEILELIRNEQEGVAISFLIWKFAFQGDKSTDPQVRIQDLLMALDRMQGQGLVQFNESIRGRENQPGLSAYTNVVMAA